MLIMDEYDDDGIIRSKRIHPPAHYLMEINPYSSFANNWGQGYVSSPFRAAGYVWNLVLYPLGKNQEGDCISLDLQIQETENLPIDWEALVHFKLFVHDQINDKYLVIQDVRDDLKRFYPAKSTWGFDELLPMQTFVDINNGYLVNDCCLFGAELFVVQRTGRYERVKSLTPAENSYKFTWKLHNFSTITNPVRSQVFTTLEDKNIKWSFAVGYVPMGSDTSRNYDDEYLSLYLVWEHKDLQLPIITQLFADFTLRVKNQMDDSSHIERHGSYWFAPAGFEYFGWEQFASVREVQRCISDNTLIFECDINFLTMTYDRL